MQFFLIFLSLSFIFFLFCLHVFGKDDFVLIRKNVSLESLFNLAFVSGGFALFFARLFFVLGHPNLKYLNPLVFFIFPYFPGLSLIGGILGAVGYLYIYARQQKYPFERILDIFSLSFLCTLPIGSIGQVFISSQNDLLSLIGEICMYGALIVLFLTVLYPRLIHNELKDGRITLYFFVAYSLISLIIDVINDIKHLDALLRLDELLLLILLCGSIVYFGYKKYGKKK